MGFEVWGFGFGFVTGRFGAALALGRLATSSTGGGTAGGMVPNMLEELDGLEEVAGCSALGAEATGRAGGGCCSARKATSPPMRTTAVAATAMATMSPVLRSFFFASASSVLAHPADVAPPRDTLATFPDDEAETRRTLPVEDAAMALMRVAVVEAGPSENGSSASASSPTF